MKSKWQYSGDVNMLDYGGKNFRQSGNRQFQIVELINMDEACGRDNEGQPKYVVELRLVDLSAISEATLKSALSSCGWENMEQTDLCLAECCDSYGAHAPLESFSGNNAHKLLRAAYRAANALLDESELESALEKPMNKIGSSAREFMNSDFMSAIQRGCESGNPMSETVKSLSVYGAGSATSWSAGWRYLGQAKSINEALKQWPDATFMAIDPGTPFQNVVWTANHGTLVSEYLTNEY